MDANPHPPDDDNPPARTAAKPGIRLLRAETGVGAALLLALVFFAFTATGTGMFAAQGVTLWVTSAAQLAMVAVAAGVLMSRGQYDLSIGAAIGITGMIIAVLSVTSGIPVWLAILAAFAASLAIGLVNGVLVGATRVPSFIVTLGTLFILRGFTSAIAIGATGSVVVGGVREAARTDWLALVFGGKLFHGLFAWLAKLGFVATYTAGQRAGQPIVDGIPMVVVWALVIIVCGHILLRRMSSGGLRFVDEAAAALRFGALPINAETIILFSFSAFCAAMFAACQVIDLGSAAADRGQYKEFEAIAAAIVGGAALAGGRGTAIGAAMAALLFAVVQHGLFYSGIDPSWFYVVVGVLLALAIPFNHLVGKRLGDASASGDAAQ